MAKKLRIALLLFVLATVAVGAWQARQRTTSWNRALDVVVFPINGDGRQATAEYLQTLSDDSFASVEAFLRREAGHYRVGLPTPVDMHLGPPVAALPPPAPVGGSPLDAIVWTLRLR